MTRANASGVAGRSDQGAEEAGQVLGGRYRVLRELGTGGMGTVYLAEHVHLGRLTAVKVLCPPRCGDDPSAEERFRREALLVARVHHPSVAQVYDFDRAPDGQFLLAMEYVEGETVAQRLERGGPFPLPEAIRVLRIVADALSHVHWMGILHRDLKPQNIMLGPGDIVKLLDFGVAHEMAQLLGTDAFQPSRRFDSSACCGRPSRCTGSAPPSLAHWGRWSRGPSIPSQPSAGRRVLPSRKRRREPHDHSRAPEGAHLRHGGERLFGECAQREREPRRGPDRGWRERHVDLGRGRVVQHSIDRLAAGHLPEQCRLGRAQLHLYGDVQDSRNVPIRLRNPRVGRDRNNRSAVRTRSLEVLIAGRERLPLRRESSHSRWARRHAELVRRIGATANVWHRADRPIPLNGNCGL